MRTLSPVYTPDSCMSQFPDFVMLFSPGVCKRVLHRQIRRLREKTRCSDTESKHRNMENNSMAVYCCLV